MPVAGFDTGEEREAPAVGYGSLGGVQVDPDGNVTYNFDGHVFARGLDMFAADRETDDADRRLRWLREHDTNIAPAGSIQTQLTALTLEDTPFAPFQQDSSSWRVWPKGDPGGFDEPMIGISLNRSLGNDPLGLTDVAAVTAMARADGTPNTQGAMVIDDQGRSDLAKAAGDLRNLRFFGPYATTLPSIAAGGMLGVGPVSPAGFDFTGAALVFAWGNGQVGTGNQRVLLAGSSYPTLTSVNLFFLNPTGAASAPNLPFRYMIVCA